MLKIISTAKATDKFIANHARSNFEKINVKSGSCRFNYKCHMNAVHEAVTNKHDKLAMCICIDKSGHPFVHFLNYDRVSYIDNTLGVWSRTYEYYLIKHINEDEFFDITNIFIGLRNDLTSKLPLRLRLQGAEAL